MKATGFAVISTLLMVGPVVAAPIRADGGAGAGYDTNVVHAASGDSAVGTSFANAWAGLGGSIELSFDDELFLDVGYDGSWMEELRELDVHRGYASFGYMRFFGDPVLLRVGAIVGYRGYRDPARSGADYGGSGTLRVRLLRPLALRLSGGWSRREASDPWYGYDLTRGRAGLDVRLGDRTRLGAWYGMEWSSPTSEVAPELRGTVQVFGREVTLAGSDALAHVAGGDLWQDLGDHVYAFASYNFVRVLWTDGGYQTHVVTAGVGFRL